MAFKFLNSRHFTSYVVATRARELCGDSGDEKCCYGYVVLPSFPVRFRDLRGHFPTLTLALFAEAFGVQRKKNVFSSYMRQLSEENMER